MGNKKYCIFIQKEKKKNYLLGLKWSLLFHSMKFLKVFWSVRLTFSLIPRIKDMSVKWKLHSGEIQIYSSHTFFSMTVCATF